MNSLLNYNSQRYPIVAYAPKNSATDKIMESLNETYFEFHDNNEYTYCNNPEYNLCNFGNSNNNTVHKTECKCKANA